MSTSSSSASGVATVSVVVASNGAPGALERCLDALASQTDAAEVIVCEAAAPDEAVRRRYPFASWHVRKGALVPVLWRDGIERATGDLVALTISPMTPAPGWVDAVRAALVDADAAGGAIEPGNDLRLADAAEHLARYARDLLPFERRPSLELAGDNAGYRRALLLEVADSWRGGFWEPDVHRALAGRGAVLVHDPTLVVTMGRSAGATAFLRQRLAHGRVFGRSRGAGRPRGANLGRAAAAVLVPLVLVARTAREVLRRRRLRLRLVVSLPFLLAFDLAWAAGEALGHLDAARGR
jgi:hypothetical protein